MVVGGGEGGRGGGGDGLKGGGGVFWELCEHRDKEVGNC